MPNKQNIANVAKIAEQLEGVSAMWVVDYRGLTVKEAEALRRAVREADAKMAVYKNTLVRLALQNAGMPDMGETLTGPSAFIFAAGDPVASAKALKDFAAKNKNLVIKGGMMDGVAYDAAQVEAIASLPSREELIAKLLGTISNPMVKMVRVCNGPMEAFARAVSAIADQKSAA